MALPLWLVVRPYQSCYQLVLIWKLIVFHFLCTGDITDMAWSPSPIPMGKSLSHPKWSFLLCVILFYFILLSTLGHKEYKLFFRRLLPLSQTTVCLFWLASCFRCVFLLVLMSFLEVFHFFPIYFSKYGDETCILSLKLWWIKVWKIGAKRKNLIVGRPRNVRMSGSLAVDRNQISNKDIAQQ